LHAVAADADAAAAAVERRLQAQGFQVGRVVKITPSLEDVFVSLIEAHDRAASPLGEAPI
jgi:ABC-2 type transport system ATP-binding protein